MNTNGWTKQLVPGPLTSIQVCVYISLTKTLGPVPHIHLVFPAPGLVPYLQEALNVPWKNSA